MKIITSIRIVKKIIILIMIVKRKNLIILIIIKIVTKNGVIKFKKKQ